MAFQGELGMLREVDQKRVNSLLEKLTLSDEQVLEVISAIAVARDRGEHWDWMRGAPAAGDKFIHWCQFILNIKDEELEEDLLICKKPKYKSSSGIDPNVQAVLDHNTAVIDKFMNSMNTMVELNKKAYEDGFIAGRQDVPFCRSPDLANFYAEHTTVDAAVNAAEHTAVNAVVNAAEHTAVNAAVNAADDAAGDGVVDGGVDTSDDAAEDTAKDTTVDDGTKKRKRQSNRRTRF